MEVQEAASKEDAEKEEEDEDARRKDERKGTTQSLLAGAISRRFLSEFCLLGN